jgi:hypothetical protein
MAHLPEANKSARYGAAVADSDWTHQPHKPHPPDFRRILGQPLVSDTDDHAHQCRLMLWIEHTFSAMSGRHLDSNRPQPQVGASDGRTALSRLVPVGSGSATTER